MRGKKRERERERCIRSLILAAPQQVGGKNFHLLFSSAGNRHKHGLRTGRGKAGNSVPDTEFTANS